jgi:hypothetical protein
MQKLPPERNEARRARRSGLMHIQQALQRSLDAATVASRMLCLVVDTAPAENSHLMLDRWQIGYLSLFEGTPEESLAEVAPLLIPVNELDPDERARLFEWVEKMAYASPSVSWFDTDASAANMATHLRQFHVVGLSEGQSMLMRWYDTRILPVWFACLTTSQAVAFTAHSSNWNCVNRLGEVQTLTADQSSNVFPPTPVLGEPLLTLTDRQYGMLVDAADLDILIGHLRRIIPDEIKQVPAQVLTQFVSRYQHHAIQAGLGDMDRQTQFVLLALYTSGKGIEHPAFTSFIESPPASLNEFFNRMQALPEDVWEAGPPLWESAKVPPQREPSNV